MTADCISRERREGTLPLLLLTRLTGRDIVRAKATAHGLRALTLGLAAVPVMVVPFVLGGVDWMEVGVSVAVQLSSFCWALAAGMLATSHTHSLRSALVWAVLWSLFLLALMMVLFGAVTWAIIIITVDLKFGFEADLSLVQYFFEIGRGLAMKHNATLELIRWF